MAQTEKKLEFLYMEGGKFLFLDLVDLEIVSINKEVVGKALLYLKEGVQLRAVADEKGRITTVQLPPFLELMVSKIEKQAKSKSSQETRQAILETGAELSVPLFIEVGDVIKVDPQQHEYIQRV